MPVTYNELHQELLEQQEHLSAQVETIAHSVREAGVGYGNHMADDATEAFEQAKDLSVRKRVEDTLLEVEGALRKFELGTYGICESCGVKIDWARLEAKPEARLCIKCRQRSRFG